MDDLRIRITSEIVACGDDCMFVALFLGDDNLVGIFLVDDPGTEDGTIEGPL